MIIVQICYIIQSTIITIPYIDIIVKFFLIGGMFMTNEKPITRKSKGSGSWDTIERKGKTYVRYRKKYPGQKSHKEFTGKSKAEVTRKVKQYEADIKDGKILSVSVNVTEAKNVKTFGQASILMLERIRLSEKPGNYNTLYTSYENYIKPYAISDININNIRQDDFEAYFNVLASKYSLSTIKKSRTFINRVFSYYKLPSLISGIKLPKNENCAVQKKMTDFFTIEESEKFYQACLHRREPGENAPVSINELVYGNTAHFLILILYTGLRIGELYALTWNDWDQNSNTISVTKTKNRIKNRVTNEYEWIVTPPKYPSSNRIVPLPERAKKSLWHIYNSTTYKDKTDNIVLTKNGIPPSQSTVTRCLHAIMKRAGIYRDGFGAHDLRHSYGSMILEKGYETGSPVDIKIISELLGHKDISTTANIYLHVLQKHKATIVSSIFD